MARTPTEARAARALLVCIAASALVGVTPAPAPAAEVAVSIHENFFAPQGIDVDPGDTVVWTHAGRRTHDVTSDDGLFQSPDLRPGATFRHTFDEPGTYYYHCSFHGRRNQRGMWGVVRVRDPAAPGDDGGRPVFEVPGDFRTIQAAVDGVASGSTIVVAPGRYEGGVSITKDDLVVRGVDRFRTVVDGGGAGTDGFLVDGASDVRIANLTVRDFPGAGLRFAGASGWTVARVDAIANGSYGVSAEGSYDGVIRSSFGWGSGAAAFRVAGCMGCGVLVDGVFAGASYVGYSGENATGVTVRDSTWTGNAAGIVVTTSPGGQHAPGRGTLVTGNDVRGNDYARAPGAALPDAYGVPIGTGVWIAGVEHTVARDNTVSGHDAYGILVTRLDDDYLPVDAVVVDNRVVDARYALGWDGAGADDCFSGNDVDGETAPGGLQTLYGCDRRPFTGAGYPPVADDVAAAVAASLERVSEVPPEPSRPACQKGRPGCRRH